MSILQDPRFSMRPSRMPVGPDGVHAPSSVERSSAPDTLSTDEVDLDDEGRRSREANLLILDGEEHSRLRRAVTARFTVRQARARVPWIRDMIADQIARLRTLGPVVDIWREYAMPIAARTHCHVIGIPEHLYERFVELFVEAASDQQKYDFVRSVLDERKDSPGEDVVSDLLRHPELERTEIEGLLVLLLSAGRDSVAYLIATASVALLTHPEQLAALRTDPELVRPAVEEFMRAGAMFLTLFARTATEDVEIGGTVIPAGTSVAVSSVAANRDPDRWENPDDLDVSRDAFGHLGFGHGIHGCVGQQVARVEIREALAALLTAFPRMELDDAEQLTPQPFAHPVAVYEAGSVSVRLVP